MIGIRLQVALNVYLFMAGYLLSSCLQEENWTGAETTAAVEPAFEPAILDLETWGSGTGPSALASSAPVT